MKIFSVLARFSFLIIVILLLSCNKNKFLDEKPDTSLIVPTTLDDFQKILDNDYVMSETPELGEVSADNFYVLPTAWQQKLSIKERNAYVWALDIYQGQGNIDDWNLPYKQVLYANVVLEGLDKIAITPDNANQWNNIKGFALFVRSYAFYNLAQVFAPGYDSNSADHDLSIPLRLKPEIDDPSVRSTVKQTYNTIISDLMLAKDLLPLQVDINNLNRPSKPAALAMLARVFLSIGDYKDAGIYADSSLFLYNTLMDYYLYAPPTVLTLGQTPFLKNNPETLYQSRLLSSTNILKGGPSSNCFVDSNLYRSYQTNDLRSVLYYFTTNAGNVVPRGGYNGGIFLFSGLATDEMYLISAECAVRNGDPGKALHQLNALLIKRFRQNSFVLYDIGTVPNVLELVLQERRKELPFRSVRWSDLRRLNKIGPGISLSRTLGTSTYSLAPNSDRYVLPIPPDVIQMTGMPQNQRH